MKTNAILLKPNCNREKFYAVDMGRGALEFYSANPFNWRNITNDSYFPKLIVVNDEANYYWTTNKPKLRGFKLILLEDAFHEPINKNDFLNPVFIKGYTITKFVSVKSNVKC